MEPIQHLLKRELRTEDILLPGDDHTATPFLRFISSVSLCLLISLWFAIHAHQSIRRPTRSKPSKVTSKKTHTSYGGLSKLSYESLQRKKSTSSKKPTATATKSKPSLSERRKRSLHPEEVDGDLTFDDAWTLYCDGRLTSAHRSRMSTKDREEIDEEIRWDMKDNRDNKQRRYRSRNYKLENWRKQKLKKWRKMMGRE